MNATGRYWRDRENLDRELRKRLVRLAMQSYRRFERRDNLARADGSRANIELAVQAYRTHKRLSAAWKRI